MFNPWIKKILWRRKWQPTPIFLLEKSYGQKSLAGYSPWAHKRVGHDVVTKQQQQYLTELSVIHVDIPEHSLPLNLLKCYTIISNPQQPGTLNSKVHALSIM